MFRLQSLKDAQFICTKQMKCVLPFRIIKTSSTIDSLTVFNKMNQEWL